MNNKNEETKLIDLIREQNKIMRKSLEFYSNGSHYKRKYMGLGRIETELIDTGEIATEALGQVDNLEDMK